MRSHALAALARSAGGRFVLSLRQRVVQLPLCGHGGCRPVLVPGRGTVSFFFEVPVLALGRPRFGRRLMVVQVLDVNVLYAA
jgi:hypothetical protein